MKTFCIQTLGCKVNQYESEQIAALLRARGMVPVASPAEADLRVINTCSVTVQAASKSRQTVRRSVRLPMLNGIERPDPSAILPAASPGESRARTIVMGCWATSEPQQARLLSGVDAVVTHHQDVAAELNGLLDRWSHALHPSRRTSGRGGTHSLPLLDQRHTGHQRAMLKVQDGCDAHCTYCIIPSLRPNLWSKPIDDVVEEARRLVASGHAEIVLTGIFLGAYGQPTALRRRQHASDGACALAKLIRSLCTRVTGLRRLRFSSLEPGDLTTDLLRVMRDHPQVVPHFHLPLQSGSELLLRRMNRQYSRVEFLRMIDSVNEAFDRPAITTDIIVGFPGETDDEFDRTLEVAEHARFIQIHAFSFSPRPGTAAARWKDDFVHGPIVNQRIERLTQLASEHSLAFRRQFIGETVELWVERPKPFDTLRHGRCERYFEVHYEDALAREGDSVSVKIERVSPDRTFGVPQAEFRNEPRLFPLPSSACT
jgi:threonylcarbamoyladenosine tRNA methylthiotransferase MtaB